MPTWLNEPGGDRVYDVSMRSGCKVCGVVIGGALTVHLCYLEVEELKRHEPAEPGTPTPNLKAAMATDRLQEHEEPSRPASAPIRAMDAGFTTSSTSVSAPEMRAFLAQISVVPSPEGGNPAIFVLTGNRSTST